MTRRERIEEMVATVLAPLLSKDGAGLELVEIAGSVVKVRISGALLGDPGAGYVKRKVIEPALRRVGGPDLEVVYERAAEV